LYTLKKISGGSGVDRNGAQRNEDYGARGSIVKKAILEHRIAILE
jgi:hypothetical protein